MKRSSIKWLAVMLMCVLSFSLVSCDSNKKDKTKEINVVFVPKLTGNAFFESANKGAQEFAEKNGFKVTYLGSPEANIDEQIKIIEDAIDIKADAICVSSLDPTALDDVLKKAVKAGIKTTTWDSDVSPDARSIMVSQGTPSQLGIMLVEMGAKSLTSRGKNPARDVIKYVWHYSQASVTDQNSWRIAGEEYIKSTYPNWINVNTENYYSEQNEALAISVGEKILTDNPEIDLIICNDSTSLPGQAEAAKKIGKTSSDVTITGFASPNSMKQYCYDGIIERWGLWDCKVQGALGCYISYYLAKGNSLKVGDKLDVPDIGTVEVMPNTVLDPNSVSSDTSGVVLLPNRTEFTINNVDDYDF